MMIEIVNFNVNFLFILCFTRFNVEMRMLSASVNLLRSTDIIHLNWCCQRRTYTRNMLLFRAVNEMSPHNTES